MFDEFHVSLEEQKEIVGNLTNDLASLNSEYEELINKGTLTEQEQKRLDLLEKQIEAYEILEEKARASAVQKEFKEAFGGESGVQKYFEQYQELLKQRDQLEANIMGGQVTLYSGETYDLEALDPEKDAEKIKEFTERIIELDGEIAAAGEDIQAWGTFLEENRDQLEKNGIDVDALSQQYEEFLNNLVKDTGEAEESIGGFSEAIERLGASPLDFSILSVMADESAKLEELEKNWDDLTKIVDEYNSTGYMTVDNFKTLTSLSSEYTGLLSVENGVLKLNSEYFYNASEQAKANAKQMVANSLATEVLTIAGMSLEDTLGETDKGFSNNKKSLETFTSTLMRGSLGLIPYNNLLFSTNQLLKGLDPSFEGFSDEQEKAFQDALGRANEIWKAIDDIKLIRPSVSEDTTKAEEETTDIVEEQTDLFNKQVEILEHELFLLEKTKASDQDRINKLRELQNLLVEQMEWYKEQGIEENDELIRNLIEQWWGYEDSISDIYDEIAEKQKEAQEEAMEELENSLEERVNKYEKLFGVMVSHIDEELERLNEERDREEEYWDNRIAALEESNDELERQIELEKLQDQLARARQTKVMVYKDGRFQYLQDIDAVNEAQIQLEAYERDEALRQEVENLEKLKDQSLDSIDAQIEAWEKYKEEWSSVVDAYEEEQDRLLVEQEFGIEAEGDNWRKRLDKLEDYIQEYRDLMSQLSQLQAAANAGLVGGGAIAGGNPITGALDEDGGPLGPNKSSSSSSSSSSSYLQASGGYTPGQVASMGGNPNTGALDEDGGPLGPKRASGTLSASGGISLVGEEGPELRLLNQGDGILPADITKNLWSWGMFAPSNLLNAISGAFKGNGQGNIYIDNFNPVLPNVQDGEGFVNYLRSTIRQSAIQFSKS